MIADEARRGLKPAMVVVASFSTSMLLALTLRQASEEEEIGRASCRERV